MADAAKPTFPTKPVDVFVPAPAGGDVFSHELRVRIPVDLHRQLLSLKVLRGMSLAETVATALDRYFEEPHETKTK